MTSTALQLHESVGKMSKSAPRGVRVAEELDNGPAGKPIDLLRKAVLALVGYGSLTLRVVFRWWSRPGPGFVEH
jgi:hypothetical protein